MKKEKKQPIQIEDDPYPPSHSIPSESHTILRFEESDLAEAVKNQIKKFGFAKDLKIHFETSRTGVLTFTESSDSDEMAKIERKIVLLDLPCLVESQKSIDNKQFYKIADICQILLVCRNENSQFAGTTKFNSGLTKPTTNIRIKRKSKQSNSEEIELQIQRLLEADEEAVQVTWNLEENIQEMEETDSVISNFVADIEGDMMVMMEEEEEEEDELEQIEEPEEESKNYLEETETSPEQIMESTDLLNEEEFDSPSNSQLQEQILELQQKLQERTNQLNNAPPNPVLRERISNQIIQIKNDLEQLLLNQQTNNSIQSI